MKKKTAVIFLGTVMLILMLAGCGGSQTDAGSTSPLPSATAGSVITTFTGKVTSKKATTFIIDMDNGSLKTTVFGEAEPTEHSGEATTTPSAAPSKAGVSKGVTVEVPSNAVVTLASGKTGTTKDIKTGNTVSFTMTDSVVTSMSVLKAK